MGGLNFKVMAKDISEGYRLLNPHILKGFTPNDYKTLHHELTRVEQKQRSEQIPLGDIDALKTRNMKLQRISNALFMIRAGCKKQRIVL